MSTGNTVNTVAVHHPRDPARPTVIPADRYDPEQHTLWGSEQATGDEPAGDDRAPQEGDGLPGGYWAERSGSWFTVFAPDGELIDKVQGRAAAVELALSHGGGS